MGRNSDFVDLAKLVGQMEDRIKALEGGGESKSPEGARGRMDRERQNRIEATNERRDSSERRGVSVTSPRRQQEILQRTQTLLPAPPKPDPVPKRVDIPPFEEEQRLLPFDVSQNSDNTWTVEEGVVSSLSDGQLVLETPCPKTTIGVAIAGWKVYCRVSTDEQGIPDGATIVADASLPADATPAVDPGTSGVYYYTLGVFSSGGEGVVYAPLHIGGNIFHDPLGTDEATPWTGENIGTENEFRGDVYSAGVNPAQFRRIQGSGSYGGTYTPVGVKVSTSGDDITVEAEVEIPVVEPFPEGTVSGDILYWDGADWVVLGIGAEDDVLTVNGAVPNWKPPLGGGVEYLDDLTDVTISTPSEGDVLRFNGTSWVNVSTEWLEVSICVSGIPTTKSILALVP